MDPAQEVLQLARIVSLDGKGLLNYLVDGCTVKLFCHSTFLDKGRVLLLSAAHSLEDIDELDGILEVHLHSFRLLRVLGRYLIKGVLDVSLKGHLVLIVFLVEECSHWSLQDGQQEVSTFDAGYVCDAARHLH